MKLLATQTDGQSERRILMLQVGRDHSRTTASAAAAKSGSVDEAAMLAAPLVFDDACLTGCAEDDELDDASVLVDGCFAGEALPAEPD